MQNDDALKVFAFYLPQFHPFALNDHLWRKGFTEWHNVVRGAPLYPGHDQPKLPGRLGFYDLRCEETLREQWDLASHHGIDGFCMYYYRFGPERVMAAPTAKLLDDPSLQLRFFYCWANEPWTKAWDGKSGEVLIEQANDDACIEEIIRDLAAFADDKRYVRHNGRMVFVIYQLGQVGDVREFCDKLRSRALHELKEDLWLGCTFGPSYRHEYLDIIDFVIQFPPHRMPRSQGSRIVSDGTELGVFHPERDDRFELYDHVVAAALNEEEWFDKLLLGTTPDWDNSPRRPKEAHVLVGASPDKFENWLTRAVSHTRTRYNDGRIAAPWLFVNAWNEWAEGAVLEPSFQNGDTALDAVSRALSVTQQKVGS